MGESRRLVDAIERGPRAAGTPERGAGAKRYLKSNFVDAWLRPRAARASGLTVREAVKYLPTDCGRTLLEARRGAARPQRPARVKPPGRVRRRR